MAVVLGVTTVLWQVTKNKFSPMRMTESPYCLHLLHSTKSEYIGFFKITSYFFCKICLRLNVSNHRWRDSMHLLGLHHLMFRKSCSDYLRLLRCLFAFQLGFSLIFCFVIIFKYATNCFFPHFLFPVNRTYIDRAY